MNEWIYIHWDIYPLSCYVFSLLLSNFEGFGYIWVVLANAVHACKCQEWISAFWMSEVTDVSEQHQKTSGNQLFGNSSHYLPTHPTLFSLLVHTQYISSHLRHWNDPSPLDAKVGFPSSMSITSNGGSTKHPQFLALGRAVPKVNPNKIIVIASVGGDIKL